MEKPHIGSVTQSTTIASKVRRNRYRGAPTASATASPTNRCWSLIAAVSSHHEHVWGWNAVHNDTLLDTLIETLQ